MFEIMRATPDDALTLSVLSRSTFIETFARFNREEDMTMYMSEAFGEIQQRNELQDSRRFILMAWCDGQAIGFSHMFKSEPDPSVKNEKPIEILRFYVDSKWHGKGVAAALMNRCFLFARENAYQSVWLGVWEKNFRAQAFYKKNGFEFVGQHDFVLGTDRQIDLIMSRNL